MAIRTTSWENRLLSLAYEALDKHTPSTPIAADTHIIDHAYATCADVTKAHSRTFYLASSLLPYHKQRAARALYAFCRVTDDLVDNASDHAEASDHLASWRKASLADSIQPERAQGTTEQIILAWSDARANYNIPRLYAHQLIDGVSRDLAARRYETFGELADYCYGVASTVGLMAMHITGYTGPAAIPYAVRLGVALQLTNILRDVGEDWQMGRFYLPQQDLADFGLTETDIAAGIVDDRWRAFMRFQIARTRQLYAEALPGIALLDPGGRFAITAAARLYQGILDDIEAHDYDVFRRRAAVSKWGKLKQLPASWWYARTTQSPVTAPA